MENGKVYRIILTTMSVLPKVANMNYYYYMDGEVCHMCNGISQLEAGTKYFLSKYEIDKIIAIDTEATRNSQEQTANEFYEQRIHAFLENLDGYSVEKAEEHAKNLGILPTNVKQMKPLEIKNQRSDFIKFVGETEKIEGFEVDNVQGIVQAILSEETKACDEIHIYIDMQGGGRTSGFVRNAVMSIIGNETQSKVKIEEIIAINFNPANTGLPSEILNETKRYKIMDLASAMNAFVRYGKADLLLSYCEERGISLENEQSRLAKLLRSIEMVDDSISLCNTKALSTAIQTLADVLKEPIKSQDSVVNDQAFVKSVFEILKDGIERDYGALLTETGDKYILELIAWCTRKGFIQQALTLVEDKMPKVFLKKENEASTQNWIVKYSSLASDTDVNDFAERIGQKFYDVENNLFYQLSNNNYCEWSNCIERNILAKAGKPIYNPQFINNTAINKSNYILAKASIGEGDSSTIVDVRNIKTAMINMVVDKTIDVELYNKSYIDNYCIFHAKQKDIEDDKNDWCNPERIYDRLKSSINVAVEKSIMYLVDGTSKIYRILQFKKDQNGQRYNEITKSMDITLSLNECYDGDRTKLDDLFRLHNALKKERNCANHAADNGIRLPAKVVKRALEIYVEEARYFVK